MRRLFEAFIIAFGFLSCDRIDTNASDFGTKADTVSKLSSISLSGHLYFYAPELDTISCEATGACDCCSGQILFLNDSDFVSIDYCLSDADYNKGKYRFLGNDLILTTDSICVRRQYNWDKETDTTGQDLVDYIITDTLLPKSTQILKRVYCKGTSCFLMGDKETYYLTPGNNELLSEIVANLKKQEIWAKLGVKNYR